jgi:hypothetical protein
VLRLRPLPLTHEPIASRCRTEGTLGPLYGKRHREAAGSLANRTMDLRLPVAPSTQDEFLSVATSLGIKGTCSGFSTATTASRVAHSILR